jgi:hypothetical protein
VGASFKNNLLLITFRISAKAAPRYTQERMSVDSNEGLSCHAATGHRCLLKGNLSWKTSIVSNTPLAPDGAGCGTSGFVFKAFSPILQKLDLKGKRMRKLSPSALSPKMEVRRHPTNSHVTGAACCGHC